MDDLTRLAVAAQQGDRVALAAWIRKTQPDVWRLCAYLVDADSADDLTQDAYLRAYQALPSFRAEASARTWLLTITRRVCADAIRRRQRSRKVPWKAPSELVTPGHASTIEIAILLDSLHPDRREAFVLTQLLGLSYAETAEVMNTQIGTIRSRVSRARAELAELLQPDQQTAKKRPRR